MWRSAAERRFRGLGFGLLFMTLGGCANPLPPTRPFNDDESRGADRALAAFLARPCSGALDADVTLRWEATGLSALVGDSLGHVPATLQVQSPDRLRFAVVSPLGQPLLIFVLDDRRFKMVNVQAGRGFIGWDDSAAWGRFAPEGVDNDEVISLLTATLAEDHRLRSLAMDREGGGYWFISEDRATRILLDPEGRTMQQRLLLDEDGEPLLDLRYAYHGKDACPVPATLEAHGGSGLEKGLITLRYDKVYPGAEPPASTFELKFPAHYRIEALE